LGLWPCRWCGSIPGTARGKRSSSR